MPTVELRECNKELVDSLLDANTNNRSYNKSAIAVLAKEMEQGKFLLTPNGVGLDTNGVLVDGQHRLLAMRMAGYPPVQFILVRGLLPESRLCVDIHRKRSMRDMLHFAFDMRINNQAPAICNVIRYAKNGWSGSATVAMSPHEMIDIVQEYKDEMEFIILHPKNKTTFSSSELAAFVMVLKDRGDLDRILEFMDMVEGGENLNNKMPAFHLRNLIIVLRKGFVNGGIRRERFLKTTKALISHLDGKQMGALRLP